MLIETAVVRAVEFNWC